MFHLVNILQSDQCVAYAGLKFKNIPFHKFPTQIILSYLKPGHFQPFATAPMSNLNIQRM